MHPANERWHYNVLSSLIGWVHTQDDPWNIFGLEGVKLSSISINTIHSSYYVIHPTEGSLYQCLITCLSPTTLRGSCQLAWSSQKTKQTSHNGCGLSTWKSIHCWCKETFGPRPTCSHDNNTDFFPVMTKHFYCCCNDANLLIIFFGGLQFFTNTKLCHQWFFILHKFVLFYKYFRAVTLRSLYRNVKSIYLWWENLIVSIKKCSLWLSSMKRKTPVNDNCIMRENN